MTFDASQLDAVLAPVENAYKETKVREPGELPPDGDYQARVEKFDFFESKDGVKLFLKTILTVVAGDEAGAECPTVHQLNDPDRLEFLKRHLTILGIEEPDSLVGLRERLGHLLGRIVEIRVKTSTSTDSAGNAYRNVYVNKVISSAGADPVASTTVPADDDIPF